MSFERRDGTIYCAGYARDVSWWVPSRLKSTYVSYYHNDAYAFLPMDIERINHMAIIDALGDDYHSIYKKYHFIKTPVYGVLPVLSDNPALDSYLGIRHPVPPEPSVRITCVGCWRVIVKHLERVKNNIVVNFRKLVNY